MDKDALIEELYKEKREIQKRLDGEKSDMVKILLKGEIIGIDVAMQLINEWEKPNHGRHTREEISLNRH